METMILRSDAIERVLDAAIECQSRVDHVIAETIQRMAAGLDPELAHLEFDLRVAITDYLTRIESHCEYAMA